MEDFSASILDGRIVFGKYPIQDEADIIIKNGYNIIVNLCTNDEITWEPVKWPKSTVIINYPIKDGNSQTPTEGWEGFLSFINNLLEILREHKLYVHCLGGHGRSATIASLLYGKTMKVSSIESINIIYNAHQKRKVMKDKWRKLGAPQRAKQKRIISNYLD